MTSGKRKAMSQDPLPEAARQKRRATNPDSYEKVAEIPEEAVALLISSTERIREAATLLISSIERFQEALMERIKDEREAKSAKPKGRPVNVERQCGVLLPDGGYCAKSLACKSHSMGLKCAVPGRSHPYDVLLANYLEAKKPMHVGRFS